MRVFFRFLGAHFKNTIRDRMALFWFLAFPVLFVFLFGLIFGDARDSWNVRVGVAVDSSASFSLPEDAKSLIFFKGLKAEELDALWKGQRDVVLSLEGGNCVLFTTPQSIEKGRILAKIIENSLLQEELKKRGVSLSWKIVVQPIAFPRFRQIDYFLPGVLAMALMQLGLFGSLDFVELREKKVTRYLGAMPLRREVILWSEITMRVGIALVQTVVILFSGWVMFRVHFSGAIFPLLSWVLFGSATFVSLGYFLTSFAKTVESTSGLIQMIQFPMMFLSGIFFPPEIVPQSIQFVTRALPLSYLGDALRNVALNIPSQFGLTTDFLVLLFWLFGSFLLAWRFFRWE